MIWRYDVYFSLDNFRIKDYSNALLESFIRSILETVSNLNRGSFGNQHEGVSRIDTRSSCVYTCLKEEFDVDEKFVAPDSNSGVRAQFYCNVWLRIVHS